MLSARESVSHSSTTKACFFMQRRRPCSPERMTCKQGQAQPRSHLLDLHDLLPDDSARALTILRNTCSDRSQSPFPGRSAVEVDTDALDSRQRRRRRRRPHAASSAQCALPGSWSGQVPLELACEVKLSPWLQWNPTAGPGGRLSAQDTLGRHQPLAQRDCTHPGSLPPHVGGKVPRSTRGLEARDSRS